ncbi:ABC transporter permease [Blautia sp.]|uniref:ABC transporter permease n=1 Tax=Blautia sp. TaxID=1955243 RepID=UPI002620CE3B|nr:ABC transporter permease [Blautia sp.]
MHHKIFLKQMKRSKKTILYLLLLFAVTAFFVTSVNLYQNSIHNLKVSEETFSTLAVTEIYGEVDKYGELVKPNSEDHIGYQAVGVKGYDVRDILDSEAVESYDLRSHYGAYIEGHPAMNYGYEEDISSGEKKDIWFTRSKNVIRFKIQGSESVELEYNPDESYKWGWRPFYLEILDDAAGFTSYPDYLPYNHFGFNKEAWAAHEEDIKELNRTDDTDKLIFYPDVEYIAILDRHPSWNWIGEAGTWEYLDRGLFDDQFAFDTPVQDYQSIRLTYDVSREERTYEESVSPFPIQRVEDVEKNPELKAYFEDIWRDISIQQYTHNVVATNDVTSVPAFHLGGAALTEGRLITQEEYEKGAKVCLISEDMVKNQKWKIGDKLDMKLFESEYIPDYDRNLYDQPIYDAEETPFVEEGEYEIVGIYSMFPTVGNTDLAQNTLEILPYNIYIPTKSISKEREPEDLLIHGSTFSVKLKNGKVEEFLADMEAKGLTERKEGRYEPKFTFYDQGYSAVESGLRSMNSTAKLLLLLSSVLLLIVCILVAYFFWQNQRQTVGIFRLLGGTKKQAVLSVLRCALILTVLGGATGGILGCGVTYLAGTGIMERNMEELETDMTGMYDMSGFAQQEADIRIQADPLATMGACGAALLYPMFLLGFAAMDIHKEPRELLPKGKS